MVAQDASSLHRSVRDNIAYGRTDVTDAEIAGGAQGSGRRFTRSRATARAAPATTRMSGARRHPFGRAAAAHRARPRLPQAGADPDPRRGDLGPRPEVEAAIQETLATIMEGRTVIAIAHRLSTIARMDRIVVLDAGHIVESGRHAELLAAEGLYARLWARQSGGFIGTSLG